MSISSSDLSMHFSLEVERVQNAILQQFPDSQKIHILTETLRSNLVRGELVQSVRKVIARLENDAKANVHLSNVQIESTFKEIKLLKKLQSLMLAHVQEINHLNTATEDKFQNTHLTVEQFNLFKLITSHGCIHLKAVNLEKKWVVSPQETQIIHNLRQN
ncbi:MAG TPA: hypothetical protein VLE96_02650 [Chlamydiales bacterium]|nr:hypothetical protein [Chlamydiales bacterium]